MFNSELNIQKTYNDVKEENSATEEIVFDTNLESIFYGFEDAIQEAEWEKKDLSPTGYEYIVKNEDIYLANLEVRKSDVKNDDVAYNDAGRKIINISLLDFNDSRLLFYIATRMENEMWDLDELEEEEPWFTKVLDDIKEDSELVEKLESFTDDIYGTIPKVFDH